MSRIILTRYDNNEEHVVVGWDRSQQTFYWQEFNREPDDWDALSEQEQMDWQELLGFAGYNDYEIQTTKALVASAATNQTVFDALIAAMDKGGKDDVPEVMVELNRHKTLDFPESNVKLDLSPFIDNDKE